MQQTTFSDADFLGTLRVKHQNIHVGLAMQKAQISLCIHAVRSGQSSLSTNRIIGHNRIHETVWVVRWYYGHAHNDTNLCILRIPIMIRICILHMLKGTFSLDAAHAIWSYRICLIYYYLFSGLLECCQQYYILGMLHSKRYTFCHA